MTKESLNVDLTKDIFEDGGIEPPSFIFNGPVNVYDDPKKKKRTKKENFKIALKFGDDWCCDALVDTDTCDCGVLVTELSRAVSVLAPTGPIDFAKAVQTLNQRLRQ